MPDGTAMNNTMRQTMGAVSIALLATIMSTHAMAAASAGVNAAESSALGVHASFRDVAIVCAVCLIAAFFVRDRGRRAGERH